MDEKLIKNIIETRKVLRKKYDALKCGKLEETTELERLFKPITAPLEKLSQNNSIVDNKLISLPPIKQHKKSWSPSSSNLIKPQPKLFNSNNEDLDFNISKHKQSTPIRKKSITPAVNIPESQNALENDALNSIDNVDSITTTTVLSPEDADNESSDNEPYIVANNTLRATDKYIMQYTKNIPSKNLDNKYGIYYSTKEDKYKIGKLPLTIENNRIIIDDAEYNLTPGLRELLFLKNPNISNISVPDIVSFKKIARSSNLLHRNYDENKQYAGSKSEKYKLLKRLLDSSKTISGRGLMKYSKNKMDYIYWDDPNELIDRLKLLLASHKAGHTNHNNEIVSIIEELKEKNYIK